MMLLGGWVFLISEVPLYPHWLKALLTWHAGLSQGPYSSRFPSLQTNIPLAVITICLQGYLAHKKPPPPRTLEYAYG